MCAGTWAKRNFYKIGRLCVHMAKKRGSHPAEAYAVLVVALVAVVGLVADYAPAAPGDASLVGKASAIDEAHLIARAPMVSMSCDDRDAHLKASAIYLPAETVGVNASNGVTGVFEDYCMDDDTLIENYCTEYDKIMQRTVTCMNGCRTGACEFYSS